jgi:hypothetical protein
VYFPALKTIHTGDLFTRTGPFIDYKNGGSAIEWTKTLQGALSTWEFDTAIPGHGAVGTRADLEQYGKSLAAMRERMSALVKQGVPREQAGDQLKIDDLGWTMSPFLKGAMPALYDEMANQK